MGFLEEENDSEWGAPSFAQPKAKTNCVRFLSDFQNLNKKLKRKPYPMPKIRGMLLILEDFRYATPLELNMVYYHIRIIKQDSNMCTIILPWGKYWYKRLTIGVSNSLDIFQEKMNEMFRGFELILAYINDHLIITKGDWYNHLENWNSPYKSLKITELSSISISHFSYKQKRNIYVSG